MIDVILRDLECAFTKPEGCQTVNVGFMRTINTDHVDNAILDKIINEKLYLIAPKDMINQIVTCCNKWFKVEKEDGVGRLAANGNPFTTYALKVSATRELLEDYKYEEIDIEAGMKVYLLMCVFNTILRIKSIGYTNLQWRRRPEIRDETDDFYFDGKNFYTTMRLAVWGECL